MRDTPNALLVFGKPEEDNTPIPKPGSGEEVVKDAAYFRTRWTDEYRQSLRDAGEKRARELLQQVKDGLDTFIAHRAQQDLSKRAAMSAVIAGLPVKGTIHGVEYRLDLAVENFWVRWYLWGFLFNEGFRAYCLPETLSSADISDCTTFVIEV
jgi:hypothetical protein